MLKEQKQKVCELESKVSEAKLSYNEALKNLERISEEIHRMRKQKRVNSIDDDISSSSSNLNNEPKVDIGDEYLEFPPKLSMKASPIRQKKLDKHDCPHLLKDFPNPMYARQTSSNSNDESDNDYKTDITNLSNEEIEQWTEIRLSHSSSSSSSGYSPNNLVIDDRSPAESLDSSSSDEYAHNKKIVTKVIKIEEPPTQLDSEGNKKSEGIVGWISKSGAKSEGEFYLFTEIKIRTFS